MKKQNSSEATSISIDQRTVSRIHSPVGTQISQVLQVQAGPVTLDANLYAPTHTEGLVVFVHGSGSSRNSPRNQYLAGEMQAVGLGTMLFDLLTPEEEEMDLRTRHLRFDVSLLARRTIGALDWLSQQEFARGRSIGLFGASTGAAAALIAAAERPEMTGAVVTRGGRVDLAAGALARVEAPVLLIVGQLDIQALEINQQALGQIQSGNPKELRIVPGASQLFEEPGATKSAAQLATDWFERYLRPSARQKNNG